MKKSCRCQNKRLAALLSAVVLFCPCLTAFGQNSPPRTDGNVSLHDALYPGQAENEGLVERLPDEEPNLFFYVSKPTTIDYGHSNGAYPNSEYTAITLNDFAGNYMASAKRIIGTESSMHQGRIEYLNDVDFYGFQASANKTYQFSVAANGTQVSGTTFVLTDYQQDGSLISSSATGSLSF